MKSLNCCLVAAGVSVALLSACSDPINDVKFENWEPEVAAPLLDTRFSLRDVLASTNFANYLTEDANSALRLRVEQQLFDFAPANSLKIPTLTVPLLDTVTSYSLAEADDFGLQRIDLSAGDLVFTFYNNHSEEATITLTAANFTLAEKPLVHTFSVPAGETLKDSVAAHGYKFAVGDDQLLDIRYTAKLASGADVALALGALSLRRAEFSYAEGSLDMLEFDLGADSLGLNFLEVFEPGQVALIDPVATLTVENEVGAPFQLSTTTAFATTREGDKIEFSSGLNHGFLFEYPSLQEGKVSKTSEIILDRETSNLVDILNVFPSALELGLQGRVNPDSLTERFFIHRDARVKGNFELDMPLAVRFDNFALDAAFVFDASSFDQAESAAFRLLINNDFGLEAATQVYFYDANEALIDSLFAEPTVVLAAAEIDEFGATTASVQQLTEVEVDKAAITQLAATRSAVVRVFLSSPEGGSQTTRLYNDNELGVQLGVRITTTPF